MQNNQITAQEVTARFKEAVLTIRKLPPVKVRGYFTVWPDIIYSQREISKMDVKSKESATPEEVSRMEEACGWIEFLDNIDDKKLVWMRAGNIPWRIICDKFGLCRSAVFKRWKKAIDRICQKHI